MNEKVRGGILAVASALAKSGISKGRYNAQQKFHFRGIDDVHNTLAPLLVASRLIVVPKYVERVMVDRTAKSGGALFFVTVTATFDVESVEDGSRITYGPFFGEGMDSADKATNKAMAAAYKYFAIQAFCIPTEGMPDSDAETNEETRGVQPLSDAEIDGFKSQMNKTKHKGDLRKVVTAALKAAHDAHDKDGHAALKAYAMTLSENLPDAPELAEQS